jgi:DNA-binding GntR family transcriptional regulator
MIPPPPKASKPNSSVLVNTIVDQIEIGILFGDYKPKEHLIQDQLAKRYGVERNVIRAALKKLEERGVIEHFPNRGSRVKEFSAKRAKDLYQLRAMLEGVASEMAAERITPAVIRELEGLQKSMERNLREGQYRAFTLDHEKFHQLIFETADNEYLLKMIKELRGASASIRNFSYSRYSLAETKDRLFVEHERMIGHLKKREGKKLGELARIHIQSGINHYLRHFFPQEDLLQLR